MAMVGGVHPFRHYLRGSTENSFRLGADIFQINPCKMGEGNQSSDRGEGLCDFDGFLGCEGVTITSACFLRSFIFSGFCNFWIFTI